jgi:hypothetical protein
MKKSVLLSEGAESSSYLELGVPNMMSPEITQRGWLLRSIAVRVTMPPAECASTRNSLASRWVSISDLTANG